MSLFLYCGYMVFKSMCYEVLMWAVLQAKITRSVGFLLLFYPKYRLKDLMKQNKNRIFVTEIICYGKA